MNEEKELTKKEEVGGGILIGTTCLTIFVLLIIGWAPVSYYLGKWSDYWDNKNWRPITLDDVDAEKSWKENNDCAEKAKKYFGVLPIQSTASSTRNGYDCYAIKYTKIP